MFHLRMGYELEMVLNSLHDYQIKYHAAKQSKISDEESIIAELSSEFIKKRRIKRLENIQPEDYGYDFFTARFLEAEDDENLIGILAELYGLRVFSLFVKEEYEKTLEPQQQTLDIPQRTAVNPMEELSAMEKSIEENLRKPDSSKSVAIFIKIFLESRENTFFRGSQKKMAEIFSQMTGLSGKRLESMISALNTGNDKQFQFNDTDFSKVKKFLNEMLKKLEEITPS